MNNIIDQIAEEISLTNKTQELLERFNLQKEDIRKNLQLFRFYNEKSTCYGCSTESDNEEDHKTMLYDVIKNADGRLIPRWIPCEYKKKKAEEEKYKENFIISHASDKMHSFSVGNLDVTPKREPFLQLFQKILEGQKLKKYPFIFGKPGIGKTVCTFSLANDLAKKGRKVAYIMVPELMRKIKSRFSYTEENGTESLIQSLKKVEYLFLDDIGGETVAEWFRDEIFLTLLEYRMQNNKPTIFTSNFSFQQLQNKYSKTNKGVYDIDKSIRLMERIKALSVEVMMEGESYRY